MRFETYEAPDGWRWRLVAGNGEIVASGEAYSRERDAKRAARGLKATIWRAEVR
jgi:uncharacterized protein YegP (UPF0339 family)